MTRPEKLYTAAACRDITGIHSGIKARIEERIAVFRKLWKHGSEEDIFTELVFCLLTPQTKARQGEKAINLLREKNLLFQGSPPELSEHLNIVRFRYRKAEYVVRARDMFTRDGTIILKSLLKKHKTHENMREFLVASVKGFGMKEASHFLRNIGLGENLAILDRHILKNLARAGCIDGIPDSITPRLYLEIEEKMRDLSVELAIPIEHMDFVLWFMETGDIFK